MATNKPQNNRSPMGDITPRGAKPAAQKAKAPGTRARKPKYTEEDIDYDYERSVRFANRGCLIASAAVLLIAAVVLLWGYLLIKGELDGNNATATAAVELDVPSGAGGSAIGELLEETGLIGNGDIFRFYVRLNNETGFQTGKHTVEPGMSYDEIIDVLTTEPPPRETMWITFPEGSTSVQFARICEDAGLFTADEFLEVANNVDLFSDIGFFSHIQYGEDTWMKSEGYLLPETYQVYVDSTPEEVVRILYEHFNAMIDGMSFETSDGVLNFYEMCDHQGLTMVEAITLASMVEEEASANDENQAKVAGVFYNRLKKDLSSSGLGRRTLGSDVTYYYVRDFIARDYDYDYDAVPWEWKYAYLALDEENLREGLPTGPISNPAAYTIEKALQPEDSNNFYFLTDFYGNYYYAETFAGHERNIATMEEQNAKYEAENGEQEEG